MKITKQGGFLVRQEIHLCHLTVASTQPGHMKTQCVFPFALLRYQYAPSERTWIEYWPTDAECQTAAYRPTCLGINDLVNLYELFRCI